MSPPDNRTGTLVQGRYRLLRRVGEGSQGKVYLAEDLARAGEVVALKLVEELVGGRRDASADHVLRWFRHPNWATVLDVGSWGESGWFEVTRFVEGTSLADLTGPQPEALVAAFLEQGARVLGALHRRGLIHYDVAPGNWLLEWQDGEPHFVLTDGGLAHVGAVRGFGRGTPRFMAPEMTQEGDHDHRVDLYSLGLIAFRLATGRDPFEGRAGEVFGRRRRERAPRLREIHPDAPAWAEEIIAALLEREPNHRPRNGLALIRLLGDVRNDERPMFTPAEAAAMARGGAMIGNAGARDALHRLLANLSTGPGETPATGPGGRKVPVVLLQGTKHSGATQLAGLALDIARSENVATVCLEGDAYRDAALRPFRDLVQGLGALLGTGDVAPPPTNVDGAVERIVSTIESAVGTSVVLFLIRSYEDFTEDARIGLQALARYAQARWLSQSRTSTRIGLLLEIGATSASEFALPDRREILLETVHPECFDAGAVRAFVADRVPGLELDDADCAHLSAYTEGLPGRLTNLLTQGCARGDVKHEAGVWAWDLTQLAQYRESPDASPTEIRQIDQLDARNLHRAGLLALFPTGLPLDARALDLNGNRLPGALQHLVRQVEKDGTAHIRLRSVHLQSEILRRFDAPALDALHENAARALAEEASRLSFTDRAQALHALEHTAKAIDLLLEIPSDDASQRARARQLALQWMQTRGCADLEPALLGRLVSQLEYDRASDAIAKLLLEDALQRGCQSADYALALVSCLVRLGRHREALRLLAPAVEQYPELTSNLDWAICEGRVYLSMRDVELGRRAVGSALSIVRGERNTRATQVWAELRTLRAHIALLRDRGNYALRLLRTACDRGIHGLDSRDAARLMNNVGILEYQRGEYRRSIGTLASALSILEHIDDVPGSVSTAGNLGRSLLAIGDVTRASVHLQRAASLALRHGLLESLAATLKQLGEIYDSQLNAELALDSLVRSLITAERAGSLFRAASAAWVLAPLAAAMGRTIEMRDALRHSARLARSRTFQQARIMHGMARCRSLIHLGQTHRARGKLRSSLARVPAGWSAEARGAAILSAISLGIAVPPTLYPSRPHRTDMPPRNAYRTLCRLKYIDRHTGSAREAGIASFQVPTPGLHAGTSGEIRRMAWEALAANMIARRPVQAAQAFAAIAKYARHAGERLIYARALCARALVSDGPLAERGQDFSDAVVALNALQEDCAPRSAAIPREFRLTHAALSPGNSPRRTVSRIEDLQALAHRLLSKFGDARQGDERLTRALRQVLHASTELDATGDVQELFRRVTQLTIDVTGAERALVAIPRGDGGYETTVSLQEGLRDRADASTASEAVINRALALRRSLLLHDVYGDEELMQRPSITGLSLRSIICAPMLRGDKFFGVVYADHTSAAGSFDESDLEVLSLFADQVARTLQARQLLTDLQSSLEELKAAQERLVRGERLRTLGELSSGVAHEFNNLLTGILARAQLIGIESTSAATKAEARLIERAAQDAAEIIRRLQSFTQRQVRKGYEPVNLEEIARDAVEFLRPLWASGGVYAGTAVRAVGDSHAQALGSATELREVVTNLLKNALDAATGGEILVRSYRRWPHVVIEVRDNGCGMPADVQRRMFDPFYTTKGSRGTGLGLPLVAQIVERHRGTISVESAPGAGTLIRIELPDRRVSDTALQPSDSSADVPVSSPLRILIVDDDDDVREPLRRYLEHAGHVVLTASDAHQGLSILQAGDRPQIVITDVCMPRLSGVEFCRRALSIDPTLCIILMTGRTARIGDADLRNSGAKAAISKPFAMQALDAILADAAIGIA